jgi:hypothetical protein
MDSGQEIRIDPGGYVLAFETAKDIYSFSTTFSITSRINSSAVSMDTAIPEGWAHTFRRSSFAFITLLRDGEIILAELQT